LLITIVNIGYYAQFKFKTSYTASTVTKEPIITEEQSKVTTTQSECKPTPKAPEDIPDAQAVSFHKIIAPAFENANNSFFEGGTSKGNAVSYAANKMPKKFSNQKAIKRDLTLTIEFKDKEIFLSSAITRKVKLFVAEINRRSKRAEFTLYVSDPKNIISSTLSKQISLGRILNIKSAIKRANIKLENIKLNLLEELPSSNPYGDIIIKAHIP